MQHWFWKTVQSFGVALFTHLERGIYKDFEECEICGGMKLSYRVSLLAVWAYEGAQAQHSAVRKQPGYFPDAPDVLPPALSCEIEILVEAVTDVVSIESIGWNSCLDQ